MSKAYRLFKHLLIAVVLLALLASVWPSAAQGDQTTLTPELKQFLQERIEQPDQAIGRMYPTNALTPTSIQAAPHWLVKASLPAGVAPSLALDSANHPHIVYASEVGIATYYIDGATWQLETLLPSAWGVGTVVVNSQDRPSVTLSGYDELRYYYRDGSGWHYEYIGQGGHSKLALDANDRPHVIYRQDSGNHALYYAYRDSSGWHSSLIDGNAEGLSLALDGAGRPHVAYTSNGLKYAYWDGSSWHIQTVASASANPAYPSIAFDAQGRPNIAYCTCNPAAINQSTLRLATYGGTQWAFSTIDGAPGRGIGASLKFDMIGRPHVSYFGLTDWTNHHLYYAYKLGSTWMIEDVTNSSSPMNVIDLFDSLALDHNGRPYLVYSNGWPTGYYLERIQEFDGASLAFGSYRDSNWEIYTARGDGTYQTRRTINPAYDSMPKLNRGANRIVFISDRDGNNEIYVMNADGSGQMRLTNTSAQEYRPTWSPDGSKIAFYSYRDGNAEIYVMNADGSNQTRLTSNASWDGHPTWSPDGTHLVFVSDRSGTDDLWIMNADGANQHQLTFGFNAAYPDWSPDGSRIIFNDDTNSDGWLDVAVINADGTSLTHPLGYSPTNYDYAAPTWSPSGQDYAFAKIQWIYYQGNYYWVDAYIYGVNLSGGSTYQLTDSGLDWWPDWQTTDVWSPSSQVKALPAFLNTTQFTVWWSGADTGPAGVMSYDIQYRDTASGIWTNWLTATNQTSAAFTGQYGHTYYFRSRARDYAGNVEAYPSGNGDTWTSVYQYSLTGQVLGNRDQPISVATVQASPAAMNTALSIHNGIFDLYFASGGAYSLTAARSGFGSLPPMLNFAVPNTSTNPIFYLPPIDDQLLDGQFESGSLIDWNPTGDVTATITTTVYSGDQAVQVGGPPPIGISNTWISAIEQTITVPPTLTLGTLSLAYQIVEADPVSDTLSVSLIGPTETLAYSLPLTLSGWTHQWWDVSTWAAPTATVRIEFTHGDYPGSSSVVFDDISWGSSNKGGEIVYLPVMYR